MVEKLLSDLKEQLLFYREIFRHSSEAIAIIDPEGRVLEQNSAHKELLGYSDEELCGSTPLLHLDAETFAEVQSQLAAQGLFRGEVQSRRKDGTRIHVELSAYTVRDEDGRVLCHVGIKRDV